MEFTLQQVIPHPRAEVFTFLGDPRNRPQWQRSLSSIDLQTDGEPRVGMRWFEQPKGGPRFEMEISVYEPIERWAEAIRSPQAEGTVSLAFSDVPAGTQVDLAVDIRFKGIFRLGTPIAKWILRREMQRDLANVVTCLATSAS